MKERHWIVSEKLKMKCQPICDIRVSRELAKQHNLSVISDDLAMCYAYTDHRTITPVEFWNKILTDGKDAK
jgi:hypothetical protein